MASGDIRTFETGATRDQDATKLDLEGFTSPAVEKRFAEYMHKHRLQSNGELRASDDWQKGVPIAEYMKSMTRHCLDVRLRHRGFEPLYPAETLMDALCALRFNVDGLIFEHLREARLAYEDIPVIPYPQPSLSERITEALTDADLHDVIV